MPLQQKANDFLLQLNKSSKDILGGLEKRVKSIQTHTPFNPSQQRDIFEMLRNTTKGSSVDLMDQLTRELSGAMPSATRINMYNTMRDIKKKMPILGRALRVWVDNILSPDDINKRALRIMVDDETEIRKEEYSEIVREMKDYVRYLQLERKADGLITQAMMEGDRFVEITTRNEMFSIAAKASNVHIKVTPNNSDISKNNLTELDVSCVSTPSISEDWFSLTIQEDMKTDDEILAEMTLLTEADKDDKDKDKKDDKPKDFTKNELQPNPWDKLPSEPYDMRIERKTDAGISVHDVVLTEIDPRNIIILHKNKWVMGYLYIERLDINTREKFPEEKPPADALLQNIYTHVRKYLSGMEINAVPEEFKDVLSRVLINNPATQIIVRYIPESNIVHFKYPSSENEPYGESYFADLLFIIKLYLARLMASTLYRIARTGKHLVFYIDVTNTQDARKRIELVKRSVKKREITADELGSVSSTPTIMSTFEDFYIPSKDGKHMVDIDTLEMGSFEDGTAEDTFYLKNILTGIEIPPSYLGVEEYNSTKATLSQESMMFARSIVRLQKIFSEQFTELLHKIYKLIHKKNADIKFRDVLCTFAPPSMITAESMAEYYNKIRSIYDDLKEMGLPEDYIRRRYMPEIEWDTIMLEALDREIKGENAEGNDMGFDLGFGSPTGGINQAGPMPGGEQQPAGGNFAMPGGEQPNG